MLHRLLIAVALVATCVASGAAQADVTPSREAAETRAAASAITLGTPVGLTFHDGQRMTGVLLDVSDRGLMVQPAPSAEPQLIDYARISDITERSTWYPSIGTPNTMRYGAVFALVIAAICALGWRMRQRRPA